MRTMAINEQPFSFCTYKGKEKATRDGNYTGEYNITYNYPIVVSGCVSSTKNNTDVETFGVNLDYDKTILLDDPKLPIDEKTLVFIDKAPIWDEETHNVTNRDYIVVKVARSLNFLQLAVKKVDSDDD